MGQITETITEKIQDTFAPVAFKLINESARHKGHAGDNGTGESHFKLMVVSNQFDGKTRVQRHRMVFQILENDMEAPGKPGIHALSLILLTPLEYADQKNMHV